MHIEIGQSLSQRLCQLSCGSSYIRRNDEVGRSCAQTKAQSEKPSNMSIYQQSDEMVILIFISLLPMSHKEGKQTVLWWGARFERVNEPRQEVAD